MEKKVVKSADSAFHDKAEHDRESNFLFRSHWFKIRGRFL